MNNTVTRMSPMKSQYQHNLWSNGFVVLPCIRPAIAPSFSVGFRPYHAHLPDSC
ncbi:hypothetical protein HPC49_43540 [Pyxidicoccus fallax]|uniref:Uncharacterized protein n=1 Tax=Pyxidicoccus fallax TaxID=394095 RepID=A0A848LPN6_9BACT|nr:hypothetical protein [Pyxidicoccus fallax]NMO19848.1 hypothetical protein [Pyxidicoccus fallax]NPC85079.1 hypothetical protein [Pyxidicoccus fallax]